MGFVSLTTQASTAQLANWPTTLHFGQVSVGQTETQLVTLTNKTQQSISITSIGVGNSEFSVAPISLPLVLASGQSVNVGVTFSPTVTGWVGGNLSFISTPAGNNLVIQAAGMGVASAELSASPASIPFGQVGVGTSTTTPITITNTRSWQVTLSGLQTQGGGFSVSGPAFPLTLHGGQSVTLNVTFTPQSAGLTYGTVTVVGSGLVIPITGTGTATTAGQLVVNPGSLNFGNIVVGTTGNASATLIASGGSVTISSGGSSDPQFGLPGVSFPLTIPAGQSILMNVAFTPQSSGGATGMLSFASNATNSTATASMEGTGTMPSVSLSWSPTSDATGYNVYRCVQSNCSYTKMNSKLDPGVTFTDSTVTPGETYFYVATSVTSGGQESGYSTPVEVAVP